MGVYTLGPIGSNQKGHVLEVALCEGHLKPSICTMDVKN